MYIMPKCLLYVQELWVETFQQVPSQRSDIPDLLRRHEERQDIQVPVVVPPLPSAGLEVPPEQT